MGWDAMGGNGMGWDAMENITVSHIIGRKGKTLFQLYMYYVNWIAA